MSLICPRCHAERPDGVSPCPYCGLPTNSSAALDQQRERDRRFPFWNILPWSLLAASLLLFVPRLITHQPPAADLSSPPAQPAAPLSVPGPPAPMVLPPLSPAAVAQDSKVPLSVTLFSVGAGKHIPVGVPIMISAYAGLPPGQTAALTISYAKDNGPKSLLSLARGSFSSTSWTPIVPGHYWFTASALDYHKDSAFSQRLSLWVDRSAPVSPRPRTIVPVHLAKAKPVTQTKPASVASATPVVSKPSAPLPYHVAAAKFSVEGIAATLAGALRRRGFNAIVRPSRKGLGTQLYVVETGDYVSPIDAQKQMQALQRDGYPAYLYRVR